MGGPCATLPSHSAALLTIQLYKLQASRIACSPAGSMPTVCNGTESVKLCL